MEWIGWLSFIIIICYSSYPGKVKNLEKEVKKLNKDRKEKNIMSDIIYSLKGKECKIKTQDVIFSGSMEVICIVLDVDDEWIKFSYKDKKGIEKIKIVRVDSIDSIELTTE